MSPESPALQTFVEIEVNSSRRERTEQSGQDKSIEILTRSCGGALGGAEGRREGVEAAEAAERTAGLG